MAESHLNGSVNLVDSEEVFRTVSAILGPSLARIPDGETGDRLGWIARLVPLLAAVPELEKRAQLDSYGGGALFALKPGISADEIDIPELGYAAAALGSWEVFTRLRDEGVIGRDTRFQVSLPTVVAACQPFIAPEDHAVFEPAYTRRLKAEAEEIVSAIPHAELAIQWDVAVEMGIIEEALPWHLSTDDVLQSLGALAEWVPAGVQLGYHLCYGDAPDPEQPTGEGKHWTEPADTAKLVQVANGVVQRATRRVDWISMPVPISRDDDRYFEPLHDLRLDADARLFLGLVHLADGAAGTQRRIATAKRHRSSFGVATECGMGRKPQQAVPELLAIHAEVEV